MIAEEVFVGHAPDKDNASYVVCAAESLSSSCCSALFSSYPRVRQDLVDKQVAGNGVLEHLTLEWRPHHAEEFASVLVLQLYE